MEIIKRSNLDIEEIAKRILAGETIIYPTETCYGLGCDSTNKEAVDRIFNIKDRQKDKSLLVLVADIGMIIDYIVWSEKLDTISKKFWPGPLTTVVQVKAGHPFAGGVVGVGNTLAFRVTGHPLACEIVEAVGRPLVSTSANIASFESPYDTENIISMFKNREIQPDIMIDAGHLAHKSPSTIVKINNEELTVLRQGGIVINL